MPRETERFPSVSVVIYPEESSKNLLPLLESIFTQNYPGEVEAIVCIEGKKQSENLLKTMQLENPNLHVTFIPDDSKNISRRKLAIYLGIKAARHEIIVTTNTQSAIESKGWLKSVVSCYYDGVDVVISPSLTIINGRISLRKILRENDSALDTLTWMASAIAGKPYRGSSSNLSFRREVFFENNGYAKTLNLHYGEDDLFVNEINTGENIAVNTSRDSVIRKYVSDIRSFDDDKSKRLFTTKGLGAYARRIASILPLTIWLNLIFGILGIVFSHGNIFYLIGSSLAIVLFWILLTKLFKGDTRFLRFAPSNLTIVPMFFVRPFMTISRRHDMISDSDSHFTWTKLK